MIHVLCFCIWTLNAAQTGKISEGLPPEQFGDGGLVEVTGHWPVWA